MSTTMTPPPMPQSQPAPAPEPAPTRRGQKRRGQKQPQLNADGTVKKPWYQMEFNIGMAVKAEEVMNFSRQMSSFLRAGVPILESLAVVSEESASKKMQEVVADMQRRLRGGSSFGDACAAQVKVFPGYYVAVVRAAELTGQLDDALDQLSDDLERDVEARREIKSSMTYPTIVFFLAIIAVIIMAVFVLPKFKSLYSSLGAKLPLPTRMLLGFTNISQHWWPVFLGGFAALIVIGFLVLGGQQGGKTRRDTLLLRLPVVGDLVHLIAIERFCRILGALVHTGVPLPDAVQVSADATNNRVFQAKLATARDAMIRGDGLARPIVATGMFPPAARQMIRVGESTGSLDMQLQNAAKFYARELKFRLKRFTDMFEPAILVIVGGAVAFVAIAQISAMYSIYHQVKV